MIRHEEFGDARVFRRRQPDVKVGPERLCDLLAKDSAHGLSGDTPHDFADEEGASRLVLERHGDSTDAPHLLFLGAQVRKRLDNKFAVTALDLATGKIAWEAGNPRLTGKGVMLSRLGGGIGTRGPGETKLETDRRRIRQRIQAVRREIDKVRRDRNVRREARQRTAAPMVARSFIRSYSGSRAGHSTSAPASIAARLDS